MKKNQENVLSQRLIMVRNPVSQGLQSFLPKPVLHVALGSLFNAVLN